MIKKKVSNEKCTLILCVLPEEKMTMILPCKVNKKVDKNH